MVGSQRTGAKAVGIVGTDRWERHAVKLMLPELSGHSVVDDPASINPRARAACVEVATETHGPITWVRPRSIQWRLPCSIGAYA
jgi:predicted kinase